MTVLYCFFSLIVTVGLYTVGFLDKSCSNLLMSYSTSASSSAELSSDNYELSWSISFLFKFNFYFWVFFLKLFENLDIILFAGSLFDIVFFRTALLSSFKWSLLPMPFRSSKFSNPIICARISIHFFIFSKSDSLQKTKSFCSVINSTGEL